MLENGLNALWQSMGIPNLVWGQVLMVLIGGLLIFLAIRKGFEPLLLLPIGFGCILANVPVAGLAEDAVGQLLLMAWIKGKPCGAGARISLGPRLSLPMRVKSRTDAAVSCINYYLKRLYSGRVIKSSQTLNKFLHIFLVILSLLVK